MSKILKMLRQTLIKAPLKTNLRKIRQVNTIQKSKSMQRVIPRTSSERLRSLKGHRVDWAFDGRKVFTFLPIRTLMKSKILFEDRLFICILKSERRF